MVVLASGRNSHDVFDFMDDIEIPYFIGSNGAVIKDCLNGHIIYTEYMDNDEAIQLVKHFEDSGLYAYAACDDGMLHSEMNTTSYLINMYSELFSCPFVDMPLSTYLRQNSKNIEKIGTLLEKQKQVKIALENKDKYKKIEIVQSNTLSVEGYSKRTNKGTALKWLMNYLNISKDNVVAIGDSDSDISMFQSCGYAIAMENGTENAKNEADFITLSNQDDDVAYAIDTLLS